MALNKLKNFLTIVTITLAALLLRLSFITKTSMTLDETQSLWQAQLPLTGKINLFQYIASDVHPPLFNFLLHYWINFFGTHALQTRILPLIFGTLSIPAVYFLANELYSKRTAFIAAIFAAANPLWIFYSLNVKNYSLFIFACILSFTCYFKLVHKKQVVLFSMLYILAQILGMYSHYFFAYIMIIQGLGALIYYKRYSIITLNIIAFMFYIPWIIYFIHYHSLSTQPSLGSLTLFNILLIIFELSLGYHSSSFDGFIIALWPIAVLLIFMTIYSLKKVSKDTMFLLVAGLLSIMGTYIISILLVNFFLTRYLVFISLFIILILASILSKPLNSSQKGKRQVFSLITLLLFFIFLDYNQMYDIQTTATEDYRGAVAYASSAADPKSILLISAPFTIYPFEYYYNGATTYQTFPYWDRTKAISFKPTERQVKDEIKTMKNKFSSIILVESFDQGHSNQTVDWFKKYLPVSEYRDFGANLQVYKFTIYKNNKSLVYNNL